MIELRSEPRKLSDETISIKFKDRGEGKKNCTHICRPQDMSAGGIKLLTHCAIPVQSEISLEIDLGDTWAVIEAIGQVKWCLEIDDLPTYYLGIKLSTLENSNRQVWKKYIEKL